MKMARVPTFNAHASGELRQHWHKLGRCVGCGKKPVPDRSPYHCPSCAFDLRRPRLKKPIQLTIADAEDAFFEGEKLKALLVNAAPPEPAPPPAPAPEPAPPSEDPSWDPLT